jgi:hypothetical protein
MSVAGSNERASKSPMGDRKSDSTINVEGDTITGTVKAGAFGAFPMSGSRKA